MAKRKTGMTVERHKEVGSMISVIHRALTELHKECANECFARQSKQNNILYKLDSYLNKFRSAMEDEMFREHPSLPNSALRVYYGEDADKLEKGLGVMVDTLFAHGGSRENLTRFDFLRGKFIIVYGDGGIDVCGRISLINPEQGLVMVAPYSQVTREPKHRAHKRISVEETISAGRCMLFTSEREMLNYLPYKAA